MSCVLSPIANFAEKALSVKLPISPQVGEMSGRTEGG
ncbi:MAG: ABC transporter ATP-binding protein, partial [Mesorhizobium sp.]